MEPGQFEDKAQEIEKTAERYVAHRWVNWVPIAMMAVCMGWMLLAAWLVQQGLHLAELSWRSGRGYALFQWIFFPLAFAGILTLICLFASWYEPWRNRLLGVKTKATKQQESFSLKQVFLTSLCIGLFTAAGRHVEALPIRFQPLVWGACFAVLSTLLILLRRIPWPKMPIWLRLWEESPIGAIAILVGAAYALAVAAGLPQPWIGGTSKCEWIPPALLPFAIIWLLAMLIGEIYSRTQFRRLQRLVAEPPAEGGE